MRGLLKNAWTAEIFQIRRINDTVYIRHRRLNGSGATETAFVDLPAGWGLPRTSGQLTAFDSVQVFSINNSLSVSLASTSITFGSYGSADDALNIPGTPWPRRISRSRFRRRPSAGTARPKASPIGRASSTLSTSASIGASDESCPLGAPRPSRTARLLGGGSRRHVHRGTRYRADLVRRRSIPLCGWVIVWRVSAVALFAAILIRPITRWAMAFSSALCGLWAVSYYLEWFAEGGRGWGTGSLFFTMFVGVMIAATQTEAQRPSEVPPRDSPEAA